MRLPDLTAFENSALWVILGIAFVALAYAHTLVHGVLAKDEGTDTMRGISVSIREGANAYLTRQFRTLALFVVVLTIVLFPWTWGK